MDSWRIEALKAHLDHLRRQRGRLHEQLHASSHNPGYAPWPGAPSAAAGRKQTLREIQELTSTIEKLEKDLRGV